MKTALISPRSILRLSKRVALAAPLLAALAACGAGPSTPDDATGTTASAATVPCTTHNVVRGSSNSWLIVWPRVSDVYLGQFWYGTGASQRATIDAFWNATANDQTFWARFGEYGIGGGSYGTSFVMPSPVVDNNPNSTVDMTAADIDHFVHAMVDAGQFPRTDNNDLFVIYLPPNAVFMGGGAYHSVYFDGSGKPFFYAVQNYYTPGWVTETTVETSHEIAEAATDPDGRNGYRDSKGGGEIGDICTGSDYAYGTEELQSIWSQYACQCIQATRPVVVDPCAKLKGTAKICCQKPYLPVCSEGLN